LKSPPTFANIARPAPVPKRAATEDPAAIRLAGRLLEAHNDPGKVEAALVYQGYGQETAKELVQGLLDGRISPPSGSDEGAPRDWFSFSAAYLLTLGLLVLTGTVIIAVWGRVLFLSGLIGGLLTSCAGLQGLIGPKRRRLSTALCLLLIVLATVAARFLHPAR
jgi:hypothetical protein